jgi:hypothetical protein
VKINGKSQRSRKAVVSVVSLMLLLTVASAAHAARYDLDSDGRSDLAWGLPASTDEGFGGGILLAEVTGNGVNLDVATHEELGVPSGAVRHESASGDYDGDGHADLVVIAEWNDGTQHRGLVVLPGGQPRPDPADAKMLELPADVRARRWSKAQLSSRDLDRDGIADLLLSFGSNSEGYGRALILWGADGGLDFARSKTVRVNSPFASLEARYVEPIALVGNTDDDARIELLVGETAMSAEDYGSDEWEAPPGWIVECDVSGTRRVACTPYFRTGPATCCTEYETRLPVLDDVVGNRYDDLVVPQPQYSPKPGRLFVYRGTADGLPRVPTTVVTQDTPGVPGSSEEGDRFGQDIAVGDVDGRGKRDLLVGQPGEDRRGAVTVIYGHRAGLGQAGGQRVDLETSGVADTTQDDWFGWGVGLRDLRGDGTDDVIVTTAGPCRAFWTIPTGARGRLLPEESHRTGSGQVLAAAGTSGGCQTFWWTYPEPIPD